MREQFSIHKYNYACYSSNINKVAYNIQLNHVSHKWQHLMLQYYLSYVGNGPSDGIMMFSEKSRCIHKYGFILGVAIQPISPFEWGGRNSQNLTRPKLRDLKCRHPYTVVTPTSIGSTLVQTGSCIFQRLPRAKIRGPPVSSVATEVI